jgi:hypothetical protein
MSEFEAAYFEGSALAAMRARRVKPARSFLSQFVFTFPPQGAAMPAAKKQSKVRALSTDEQYDTRITDEQQEAIEEFIENDLEYSGLGGHCNVGDVVDALENIIESAQSLKAQLIRRAGK